MAESNTRQASRAPVTLKIKFKSETLDQFIERYSVDISHGGIFIRTKDPLAVGTTLRFEFQLKDATPLIIGDGTVVWTREHDPKRAGISPGMGVRFDKLPAKSQKILDKVLAKKNGEADLEDGDQYDDDDDGGFKEEATRVAPAELVDSLMSTSGSDYEERDPTPLPKPMPFHSDANDFSDAAFAESTKVASLDAILAHAQAAQSATEADDGVIASSTRPATAPPVATPAPAAEADPFGDLSDVDDEGRADTRAETRALNQSSAEEAAPEADKEDELAARRAQEAEERSEAEEDELEEGVTTSSSSSTSTAKAAAVLAAPEQDEGGSSMRWIGVATVILLIGGAGGFWLLNNGDDKNGEGTTHPIATAQPTTPAAAPAVPDEVIKDPIKDPVVEPAPTKEVSITTVPEGATVSVQGTDFTGESPATFELEEGKTFTIEVTHAGFVPQSLEIIADGSPIETTTLVAMAKTVRFTSEPPGALVTVNGRRLRGRTPTDMPLAKNLAGAPLRVQLRLPGYRPLYATLPAKDEFVAENDKLVKSFAAKMVPVPARPRPRPNNNAKNNNNKTNDGTNTNDGTDTTDNGTDTTNDGTGDKPDPVDPPDPKPDEGEPTPDWMK